MILWNCTSDNYENTDDSFWDSFGQGIESKFLVVGVAFMFIF